MTTNRSIALVVEGIGSDRTYTNGIAWYYGRSTIDTANGYEWIGGAHSGQGLVSAPQSVASTVDPFNLSFRGSEFRFQIHADRFAKRLWLPRPLTPYDSLSAAIDTDATGIVFTGNASWSASDDNRIVWIGDEAIDIGTHQAGSTFAGATREMFGTQAIYYPAGKSVYVTNPKHIGRYCKVILYDHDTGTVSQGWQGFISAFSIDGPVINVTAREVLSSTMSGTINRGQTHIDAAGLAFPSRETLGATGRVRFRDRPGTVNKRVNKSNATTGHWLALRFGGAAVYAKWDSTTNSATLQDGDPPTAVGGNSYEGSVPILGGRFDRDARQDPKHELLVVDRERDTSFGLPVYNALLGTGTYANMRSSTRDLGYPFHPVAISMALLTSGPNPTPGTAGTGAVGEDTTPTSFGTTATFQQKTNYFSGTGLEVWSMSGRGLTDKCAIGRRLSSTNNDGLKLIDNAGGTDWTADNSGISAAAQSSYGIYTDADYVWWCFDGNSGSRAIAQRIGVSDGVIDWTSNTGTGSPINGLGRTITLDVANDDLIVLWADGGDEVQAIDATSGTLGNDTDDTSVTGSQGACAVCVTGDGSLLLVAGDNERVEYHSTPLANGSAGTGTLNFASGSSDVTNTATGFSGLHNADTPEPTLFEDRNGGTGAWLCGGRSANHNDPYIWHIDPTTPSVDIEIDVTSDWGLTPGTYNYVMSICVDKFGDVWALCTNNITGGACDIVRYNANGTFVQSFATDGVSNLPDATARTIAIDDSGNVYVGDKSGDVSVWTMS